MSARDDVLARVRAAQAVEPLPDGPTPRDYRRHDDRRLPELLDLLVERLTDYQATVHRGDDATTLVRSVLGGRSLPSLVVPDGVPDAWRDGIPGGIDLLADDPPLSAVELDGVGGVLTGCRVAIAETGTLVLDGGPGQGRRMLSLVPDYCLVMVTADQVVGSVPQAVAALDPSRPLTWVSGPSATSDIELNRVEGVHGPRTLDVILLG
ncbi:MAG: L-lactate dehydrogenase complex protein LldG [Frankiaceae bacterium]|nr:L-lactate dehydrogenase complex protein LldG [Frankiaceae bacterium]